MGGSSSSQQQATTTSTPSAQQQQLINLGMPFAQQYAGSGGIQLPSQAPIAGFTPAQQAGQAMAIGATPTQQGVVQNAAQGTNFLTSGAALDPNTNPGLMGSINYALDPIQRNFTQTVLPGIASGAAGVGGFGGSRQGIAEGIASQNEQQQVAGTVNSMVSQNYQNALDQIAKGAAVAPGVAEAQVIPATTMSGVGDVQQALNQALATYGFQSQLFPQMQPITMAEQLLGLSSAIPGGTTTSSGTGTAQMSPLQQAIGIASIGSSLFGGSNSPFSNMMGGLGSLGAMFA